jgi:hypothetical protein
MATRILQEEVSAAFKASSKLVLANYAVEDVQHMGQAELQRVKSLLGHGEEWTRWLTPRGWFPGGSQAFWNVCIEERIKANLPVNLTQLMQSDFGPVSILQDLVDQTVLACNRYLVLCRIGPVHLGNGRDSLDPSVVAQIAHQSVCFLAAISIGKTMAALEEPPVGIDEGEKPTRLRAGFASVSKEDVDALSFSISTKANIHTELKRMHAASTRGLWADTPLVGVNPQKTTRVSGDFEAPPPEALSDPHLPLPDDYLCEIGQKSHWIIKHLGPNILRILSMFRDLWQEAHESGIDVRALSDRCAVALSSQVWIDADGQLIDQLPFELKLNRRGGHSKKTPKANIGTREEADTDLENLDRSKRTEAWPPRRATQVFGLARVLQGAHLFVAGLSTGSRNGEILTMERSAVRRAPDGTVFANGRTYKLVRRHDGQLRDWPLPEFAECAFEQQAKLICLMERLSPLSATKLISNPLEITEGSNLWFGSGDRSQPATSHILQELLRHYSKGLGLEPKPDGQGIRPHRLRKTLARLVALAIVQAPKLLQDVLGHKHIEMTIYYILADKALSVEIDEIVRELRVIRCADDLSKFVSTDIAHASKDELTPSESTTVSNGVDPLGDGYGGPAAASIRRAVAEHGHALHQRSQDWGAEDIRDLAEILTLGGTAWSLVRPGVMCTKSLNQFGPCNKKRGHPDPASCQTSCDYRLEQAWLREDVDSCISQALEHWELETASQQDLVAEFWAGQVRMHIGRFADLEKKWQLDPRVQLLCGSQKLCET